MTVGVFLSITAPAYSERENIEQVIADWLGVLARDRGSAALLIEGGSRAGGSSQSPSIVATRCREPVGIA